MAPSEWGLILTSLKANPTPAHTIVLSIIYRDCPYRLSAPDDEKLYSLGEMKTFENISQLYEATTRFRRVGLLTLSAYLLFSNIEPWRLWACFGIIVLLLGSELADRYHVFFTSWPARWRLTFIIAFTCQTTVIIITGGIHSPFVIVYLPIVMLVALSQGWRGFIPMASAQLIVLWGLTFLEVFGRLPAEFYPAERLYPTSIVLTLAWCALFSTMLIALGVVGLKITQVLRESAEAALKAERAAAEALQVRNQDLISLTGAVAHELKNPLTAVQSLATLLQSRADTGTRDAEMLDVMVEELHRVRDTLQEFLDFSRPMDPLQTQPVVLATLAEQIIRTHRGMAQHEGIDLTLEGSREVVVSGDPRKLQQVLTNMLQNAIEASPSGGSIVVQCHQTPTNATIAIRDHGKGLDPALKEGLFRPGATTKPAGTGLGLTISQSIAEQHGGVLTLADATDGGCIATLTLPTRLRKSS
ncbi:MAG: two-component system sensor histidine kinase HydH [Myxococcota bacterium]|jgi:two-component system sensor histidine kinase HydH